MRKHPPLGLLLVAALACSSLNATLARQATNPASDAPGEAEPGKPPAKGFAVLAAQYGTDERWIDVTDVIRASIRNGSLDRRPGSLPDPAFGIHKNLVVLYSIDGKVGLSIARDDRRVVLPGRGTMAAVPPDGFEVLSAGFGHDNKWVNVTGPLRGWIEGGRLEYPNPKGVALPDPVVGTHKALVVAYAVDGEARLWIGRDDRKITLPETEPDRGRRADSPTQVDLDYLKLVTDAVGNLQAADLPRLEELDLGGSAIDGAGLVHLRGLKGLRRLSLADTRISDIGLKNLAGLRGLRALDLSATPLTDAGMPSLRALIELRDLSLRGTKLTDAGLIRLSSLTRLEDLDLSGTNVTDAGLVQLKALRNLRRLRLSRPPLTDAGIGGLKRALPDLQVGLDP